MESGKKALIFMSNRVMTDSEDYFAMLSLAIDVFTHTWSLSVEVQFYLFVPFLYLIGARLLPRRFEITYYCILGSVSYIYSIVLCTEEIAFHSVAARLWQFSVGMAVYLISDSQNILYHEKSNKGYQLPENHRKILLLVILVVGSLFPLEIPSKVLRLLITFSTGFLMITRSKLIDRILETKFLTYFGDISYSLYLIHWPIYAFWKLMLSRDEIWNFEMIGAVGVTVLVAILSYHFYEKWYLKQSNEKVFVICFILFLFNNLIFHKEAIENSRASPPVITERLDGLNETEFVSFERAAELNKKWSVEDIKHLRVASCDYENKTLDWMGFCRHKGFNSTSGKYKLMLIGNSWAANQAVLLYQECGYQATSLSQMVAAICDPLTTTHDSKCSNALPMFEKRVEKEKPDYLFIISRFQSIGDPMNFTNIEDDPVYNQMSVQIENLSKHVKFKIFLMHQITRMRPSRVFDIVNAVKEKRNLTDFDNSIIEMDSRIPRLRYEKMVSGCPKCELFDYKPYFFNTTTQTWRFYNEKNNGLSYINAILHLTPHGLELVRPVFRNVCRYL
uniref:Acyl_transf_3 domain-containing protein n=1 Tax=Caenorhabditis tropicalis TaxID=1561998 RepID=A0A1I7UWP5_9PELO